MLIFQFNPLEQLMGVFPAASSSHVPKPWAKLMSDPVSYFYLVLVLASTVLFEMNINENDASGNDVLQNDLVSDRKNRVRLMFFITTIKEFPGIAIINLHSGMASLNIIGLVKYRYMHI